MTSANLITSLMKTKQKLKETKKIKKKRKTKLTKFMNSIYGFFYLMAQCVVGIVVINYFANIKNNKNISKLVHVHYYKIGIN